LDRYNIIDVQDIKQAAQKMKMWAEQHKKQHAAKKIPR
jgi:hypothetical protein